MKENRLSIGIVFRKLRENRLVFTLTTTGVLAVTNYIINAFLLPFILDVIDSKFNVFFDIDRKIQFCTLMGIVICITSFWEYINYNIEKGVFVSPVHSVRSYKESISAGLIGIVVGIAIVSGVVIVLNILCVMLIILAVIIIGAGVISLI